MISILIPIYNTKVVNLVDELIDQCKKAKTNFEIICLDDCSQSRYKEFNREVNGRFGVNYVELSSNIGRAKIRNRLVKLARYEWLLFLDADSKIRHKKFIKNYLEELSPERDVIVGGTQYSKRPPRNSDKLLHWNYGVHREAIPSKKRNRHPSRYFHSNNFMITRKVMERFPFQEDIKGYGYEDLALGEKLQKSKVSILHIDNPIQHLGLKSHKKFLSDQKMAVSNLALLYKEGDVTDTKLIWYYNTITRTGLIKPILSIIGKKEKVLLERLQSAPSWLLSLDLLKLYYFDQATNNTYTKAK